MKKWSTDEVQKNSLTILQMLRFSPVSHQQYPYSIEILGYIEPSHPLTVPAKIMVEVVLAELNVELIETFYKAGKNALAERLVVFCDDEVENFPTDVQVALSRSKTDFFGKKKIETLLQSRPKEKIQDIVSLKRLISALPELARRIVPNDLAPHAKSLNLISWQIFEDAVFVAFRDCFHYQVRQFGKETLLEREPEGVVVTSNENSFAFIYDCKSSSDSYNMKVEDERAYAEYVRRKKPEVIRLDKSELRYLVIVSPEFGGDPPLRAGNLARDTGIQLVCLRASTLQRLSQWANEMSSDLKGLIDLGELFTGTDGPVIKDEIVGQYIAKFDLRYRNRY